MAWHRLFPVRHFCGLEKKIMLVKAVVWTDVLSDYFDVQPL